MSLSQVLYLALSVNTVICLLARFFTIAAQQLSNFLSQECPPLRLYSKVVVDKSTFYLLTCLLLSFRLASGYGFGCLISMLKPVEC